MIGQDELPKELGVSEGQVNEPQHDVVLLIVLLVVVVVYNPDGRRNFQHNESKARPEHDNINIRCSQLRSKLQRSVDIQNNEVCDHYFGYQSDHAAHHFLLPPEEQFGENHAEVQSEVDQAESDGVG